MIIDLHTHTDRSDGMLSPFELVDRAHKNHVSVLSIADHDTLAAYDQNVIAYADDLGISLIPGIEISTIGKNGKKWHILGHFIDPFDPILRDWLELQKKARKIYAKEVVQKLKSIGWRVDDKHLLQFDVVSKAHISDAVLNNPNNKEALLKKFQGRLPSRGEFIENTLNKGCPAYVQRTKSPTPEEAITVIRKAEGVATVAHPIAAVYEQDMTFVEIAETIKELKPDGIEAYYYYYSKSRGDQKFEMVQQFEELADHLEVVPTGGSDFHGVSKQIGNFTDIGMVGEQKTMSISQLQDLRSRQVTK